MDRFVSSRQTTISFGRGLFVLRYASCDVPQSPPRVRFAVAGNAAGVRVVPAPGATPGVLAEVGALTVIASEGSGALDVVVEESRPGGGVGCSLALDRLGGAAAASEGVAPLAASGLGPTAPAVAPQLVAHLSHRGDSAVALGDWAGGPQAPTPIEGFAVAPGALSDAGLQYQVLSIGADRWSEWVAAGSFAGTRGQGRALRGLRLRVAASARYTLTADVLFLGATIDHKVGPSLEFMSSSPFDAMVGLRLELAREAAREVAPSTLSAPEAPANRLRVFRSSRAS